MPTIRYSIDGTIPWRISETVDSRLDRLSKLNDATINLKLLALATCLLLWLQGQDLL